MDAASPTNRHEVSDLSADAQIKERREFGLGDGMDPPPERNDGSAKQDDGDEIDLRRTFERRKWAHGATILAARGRLKYQVRPCLSRLLTRSEPDPREPGVLWRCRYRRQSPTICERELLASSRRRTLIICYHTSTEFSTRTRLQSPVTENLRARIVRKKSEKNLDHLLPHLNVDSGRILLLSLPHTESGLRLPAHASTVLGTAPSTKLGRAWRPFG